MTFTNEQKRKCAEREVAFRRVVYDRKIAEGKMTQAAADRQIGMMAEIASDYAELEKKEKLI